MESIGARISKVVEISGLTKTDFAKRLNLSQSMVSKLCSGVAHPSERTILDICRVFGVSETWLRFGNGNVFNESIGGRIREYRLAAGMTVAELAASVDLPESSIRVTERGERQYAVDTLKKIADALNVELTELLGAETPDEINAKIYHSHLKGKQLRKQPKEYFAFYNVTEANADLVVELVESFSLLNNRGQHKVLEYTRDLTQIPEYFDGEAIHNALEAIANSVETETPPEE